MNRLSWAGFYEGPSDRAYFDVLIPRLMQETIERDGLGAVAVSLTPALRLGAHGRQIESVAQEICDNAEALDLVFIHADTGRGLARRLDERSGSCCGMIIARCDWKPDRCVVVAPAHETEAWALADPSAVTSALGYRGSLAGLGLPEDGNAAENSAIPR